MPPQQAYGLLDLIDQILRFRPHLGFVALLGVEVGGADIWRAADAVKRAGDPDPMGGNRQ